MKRSTISGFFLFPAVLALTTAPASADLVNPSGSWTAQFNGTDYNYTITLTNLNTSTGNIGTFWFAWIPGQDYLPDSPVSTGFVTPSGWTQTVTHAGSADGFAIQWKALTSAAYITPGNSLTFGFESVDTPIQIAGNSPFYTSTPVATSTVYPAAPFSDSGHRFVLSAPAVPVPPSLLLTSLGGFLTIAARRFSGRRTQPV